MQRSSVLAALLGCAIAIGAFAQHAVAQIAVPKHDGWVTDLGSMLTPAQERQLEALMESYRAGTTHEVALLTVASLDGTPIERFALEVGRAWKIGKVGEDDGALLVVSRDDRKIRIEVGRGLEGGLTDSIAGRIIRNVIAPEFRNGRTFEGLRDGIRAIHAAIGGDYAAIPERAPRGRSGSFVKFATMILMFVVVLLFARRGRGGRGGGRRRGSGALPWLIAGSLANSGRGGHFGVGSSGGFGGFGGGGGFSGGGASGGW